MCVPLRTAPTHILYDTVLDQPTVKNAPGFSESADDDLACALLSLEHVSHTLGSLVGLDVRA